MQDNLGEYTFFRVKSGVSNIEEVLKKRFKRRDGVPCAIANCKNIIIFGYEYGKANVVDLNDDNNEIETGLDSITNIKIIEISTTEFKAYILGTKKVYPYIQLCTIYTSKNIPLRISLDHMFPALSSLNIKTLETQYTKNQTCHIQPTSLALNTRKNEIYVSFDVGALAVIVKDGENSQKECTSRVIYSCQESLLCVVCGVKTDYIYALSAYRIVCFNGTSKDIVYDGLLPGTYSGTFISLNNDINSEYANNDYDVLVSCREGYIPVGGIKGMGNIIKSHNIGRHLMSAYGEYIAIGYPALTDIDMKTKPEKDWGNYENTPSEVIICEYGTDLKTLYKHNTNAGNNKTLGSIYYMFEYKKSLYVLLTTGMICTIYELDIMKKLKLAFEQKNYELAFNLMTREKLANKHLPPVSLIKDCSDDDTLDLACFRDPIVYVQTKQADRLFDMGFYEKAVDFYSSLETLNESYVLGKLLSKDLDTLTIRYIEILINQNRASFSVKKLLCTYYIYHSKVSELKEIISSPDGEKIIQELEVDLFKVPSKTMALKVSQILKNDSMYVEFLINVEKSYREAARFFLNLDYAIVTKNLEKYAETLLLEAPNEMRAVMSELSAKFSPYSLDARSEYIWPEKLAFYFKMDKNLFKYIEDVLIMRWGIIINKKSPFKTPSSLRASRTDVIDAKILERDRKSKIFLCNILLESYVVLNYHDLALILLSTSGIELDWKRALFVCDMHKFVEGSNFICKKIGIHDRLLIYYIKENNVKEVLNICSSGEKGMWIKTLRLLVESAKDGDFQSIAGMLKEVCKGAYDAREVSALELSELVSNIDKIDMDSIREIMSEPLSDTMTRLSENKAICIDMSLKSISKECQVCGKTLEFPITVFRCGHAIHEKCEKRNKCNKCTGLQDVIPIKEEAIF